MKWQERYQCFLIYDLIVFNDTTSVIILGMDLVINIYIENVLPNQKKTNGYK